MTDAMIDSGTITRTFVRTELVLCHCLQITETEVVDAIELLGLSSLREVRHCTGAGTGCNSCHRQIHACLDAVNG